MKLHSLHQLARTGVCNGNCIIFSLKPQRQGHFGVAAMHVFPFMKSGCERELATSDSL